MLLYAAEVFELTTVLKLIIRRSKLMTECQGGAMTAVMGFDRKQLEDLIAATEDVVIANDNSSSQVVLSGSPKAVNLVSSQIKCKRAISLPVSGAFHSPFMSEAANLFAKDLDNVIFSNAKIPVLSNSDPTPSCEGKLLKQRLKRQMVEGVRWREIMEKMSDSGIKTVVEIGPGNVLTGLVKRSIQGVVTSQLSNAADLGH